MHGFYKVASAVPKLEIANPQKNSEEIINLISIADKEKATVIVFPELSITGYTCADLFFNKKLIAETETALLNIKEATKSRKIIVIVGAPFYHNSSIYNCAYVINDGIIHAIIPKTSLPNYREFYEKRWFSPAPTHNRCELLCFLGEETVFGTDVLFELNQEFKLAVELCEDLWSIIPPSSLHAIAGATVIANLSASNELVCKKEYRKSLVCSQSAKCTVAYIYTSAGITESTADLLYSGHAMIAENGNILTENERFSLNSTIIFSEVDCQKLLSLRQTETSAKDMLNVPEINSRISKYHTIKINSFNKVNTITRTIDPYPFIPSNKSKRDERCNEIFDIQSSSLAKRIEHTKITKTVIGISGGLDSTLALLVIKAAYDKLKKATNDIIAVTMPGFGTTDRTYSNAIKMCKILNCDLREITINDICNEQFKLINFDPKNKNTTYENVQARQRTMLLMNIANNENGIVIGTGDLSEIALGWSTYNGDHMSMYAVNCGVTKTLIRYLISWCAEKSDNELSKILVDIIDTPVSPELIPPDKNGTILQKTEDIIGPYELHDFFLYHFIKYGATPEKIKILAISAFKDKYTEAEISKFLKLFISRFFSQQFKRNCIPDGPKVGTISLSPRGDWRMPPDAASTSWL